jgi:hypothetical protein
MIIDSAEWVTQRRAVQHQPRNRLLQTGYHDCRPDDKDASEFLSAAKTGKRSGRFALPAAVSYAVGSAKLTVER